MKSEEEDDMEDPMSLLPLCILNDVKNIHEEHQEECCFSPDTFEINQQTYDKHGYHASRPLPMLPLQHSNNGMGATYLQTGQSSCGTRVFIPYITRKTKKPVSAPLLFPTHAVQVLNLNGQASKAQRKPQGLVFSGIENVKRKGRRNKNSNDDTSS